MRRTSWVGLSLAFLTAGCVHDSAGHRVRTGQTRFDASTLTGPHASYSLESDGTWAGIRGDRYERDGDDIRKVGAFAPTPSLIRASGSVRIDRRQDGVTYTPSYLGGAIWTFVTEDDQPIPADLEVPLYLAARLGLPGQWVNLWTPGSEKAGVQLEADCGLVLFDVQGRQMAGWVSRQGAVCPRPRYPGRDALARLVNDRNEIWETPVRPLQ